MLGGSKGDGKMSTGEKGRKAAREQSVKNHYRVQVAPYVSNRQEVGQLLSVMRGGHQDSWTGKPGSGEKESKRQV